MPSGCCVATEGPVETLFRNNVIPHLLRCQLYLFLLFPFINPEKKVDILKIKSLNPTATFYLH